MSSRRPEDSALIGKLRDLPPDRLAEVEDFVDFLREKDEDQRLRCASMKLSEGALEKVWDNPADAAYDEL